MALLNLVPGALLGTIYLSVGRSLKQEALRVYEATVRGAAATVRDAIEEELFRLGTIALDEATAEHVRSVANGFDDTVSQHLTNNLKRIKVQSPEAISTYVAIYDEATCMRVISDRGTYQDPGLFHDAAFLRNLPKQDKRPRIQVRAITQPAVGYHSEAVEVLTFLLWNGADLGHSAVVLNLETTWLRQRYSSPVTGLAGTTFVTMQGKREPVAADDPELAAILMGLSTDAASPSQPRRWVQLNDRRYAWFAAPMGNDLTLHHAVTLRGLYGEAISIRTAILIAWIGLFALSVPIAMLLTQLVYRPINEIYEFLLDSGEVPNTAETKNEVHTLLRTFRRISGRNSLYQRQIAQYKPLHDEVVIMNALIGNTDDKRRIQQNVVTPLEQLESTPHWCIIIGIDSYQHYLLAHSLEQRSKDLSFMLIALRNEFEGFLSVSHLLEDRIVCLVPASDVQDAGALAIQLRNAKITMEDYLQNTVTVAVGAMAAGLQEIPSAYGAAETALEHKYLYGKGKLILQRDVGDDDARETVSEEQLKRLQYAVKGLKRVQAAEVLKELLSRVQPGRNLKQVYSILAARILTSLQSVVDEDVIKLPTAAEAASFIESSETLPELETWFFTILNKLFHQVELAKGNKNTDYLRRIQEIVEENYANPILQISDVAARFSLSATYFGRFFHELTGTNFTNYVNEVRLRHAAEELIESDRTVKEIAERSGFNSTQYFIRVFKKRYRTTPKSYRLEQRKEQRASPE